MMRFYRGSVFSNLQQPVAESRNRIKGQTQWKMEEDDSLKQGIIAPKGRPDSGHRRDSRHCLRAYVDKGTIANRDTASVIMWMKKTSWVNESLCQVSTEKKRTRE